MVRCCDMAAGEPPPLLPSFSVDRLHHGSVSVRELEVGFYLNGRAFQNDPNGLNIPRKC